MTSINAGGAFYRVQNSLNQNSEERFEEYATARKRSVRISRLVTGPLRVRLRGA